MSGGTDLSFILDLFILFHFAVLSFFQVILLISTIALPAHREFALFYTLR